MEFKAVIEKRRSVRKFSEKRVERTLLQQVLDAALAAPSSRNSHSTSFLVVERETNAECMAKISHMRDYGAGFVKDAPAAIVVMGDRTKTDLAEVNASICATVVQYAATSVGLASCWVHVAGRPMLKEEPEGTSAEQHLRTFLPIPADCDVLCIIAIGHSDFEPAPLPNFDKESLVEFL